MKYDLEVSQVHFSFMHSSTFKIFVRGVLIHDKDAIMSKTDMETV